MNSWIVMILSKWCQATQWARCELVQLMYSALVVLTARLLPPYSLKVRNKQTKSWKPLLWKLSYKGTREGRVMSRWTLITLLRPFGLLHSLKIKFCSTNFHLTFYFNLISHCFMSFFSYLPLFLIFIKWGPCQEDERLTTSSITNGLKMPGTWYTLFHCL